MSDGWFGLVELSMFFGLPVAWGVWELVRLRREQRRDRERERAAQERSDMR